MGGNYKKQHYTEILQNNISQATTLKDRLLEAMTSPDVSDRITNIDTIIDQLIEFTTHQDSLNRQKDPVENCGKGFLTSKLSLIRKALVNEI